MAIVYCKIAVIACFRQLTCRIFSNADRSSLCDSWTDLRVLGRYHIPTPDHVILERQDSGLRPPPSRLLVAYPEDWGGFIGQWDDRQWSFIDSEHDRYGEMTGLKPRYIKRADLAWYCDHHHDAAGQNIPYSYSYLFAYKIDLVPAAQTIKLPDNPNVRILAISVADENPELNAAQPRDRFYRYGFR
jgi:hypothetical protein